MMIFKVFAFFLYLGLLLAFVSPISPDNNYPQILIDLNNIQPGESITEFHNITSDAEYTEISILNINNPISFFIIQVHTFSENVTLSYEYPLDTHSFTSGTNIGLVWNENQAKKFLSTSSDVAVFYLVRNRLLGSNLDVLLVISTYSKDDPVPGGCNLSFETELAPYQKINQTDEIITVISQPPSLFAIFCNNSNITTETYYLYLTEYKNSRTLRTIEYFAGIQKMLTLENITRYGTKVPEGLGGSKFKQMYNRYSGTGRIFAMVATYEGRRNSVYVPAASFGCNVNEWEDDCIGPVEVHWKLVIAMLLFCGLFLCLGGHRFFRTGLFITGYTFGVIIMLIVVTIDNDFSDEGKAVYSLIMGVLVAITWLFLWWKFGVPVIAVQLTFLLTGLIVASILFYTQLGDVYIFADSLTFWACFGSILLISQLPLLCLTPLCHIIALSLISSYAVIVAMNYYVGGNLPYILINTYRRMTVKDFGMAVVAPPYQLLDISQTILWIAIFGVGIFVQYKHSLGKPPFPPHRSGVEVGLPPFQPLRNVVEVGLADERTPLRQAEQPPPYSI